MQSSRQTDTNRSCPRQLSPQEFRRLRDVGIFAESRARSEGRSVLPEFWQQVPVTDLQPEILVYVAITELAMADADKRLTR